MRATIITRVVLRKKIDRYEALRRVPGAQQALGIFSYYFYSAICEDQMKHLYSLKAIQIDTVMSK